MNSSNTPAGMISPLSSCGRHDVFEQLSNKILSFQDDEKYGFLTALQVAPHLVFSESDPLIFLKFANFNTLAAARGLAMYWKRRLEVFGQDRAFRPLILTGYGALTPEDVVMVRSGYTAYLPNDNEGCSVVVTDTSRRNSDNMGSRLRTAFYLGNIAMLENSKSQTDGWVLLRPITNQEPASAAETTAVMNVIMQTFPYKAKAAHLFSETGRDIPTQQFSKGLSTTFGNYYRGVKLFFYSGIPKEEIKKLLISRGLKPEAIPSTLGGDWTYEEFYHWFDQRQEKDRKDYPFVDCVNSLAGTPQTNIPAGIRFVGHRLLEGSLEKLPASQTKQYAEALIRAHDTIWEEEANRQWFLESEFYHPIRSARRLLQYWTLRCGIFLEHSYLSLYQTGNDALRRADIMAFQTGFIEQLPPDNQGSPVLFLDMIRLPRIQRSVFRCLFYMFSILAGDSKSRTKGVVLILRVGELSDTETDILAFLARLADASPLLFKAAHLVCPNMITAEDLEKRMEFADAIHRHTPSSRVDLLSMFLAFGFTKSGLPRVFGGHWGYQEFTEWREVRTRMEFQIPLGVSGNNKVLEHFPSMKDGHAIIQDKPERDRRLNAIHARRKRDRIRIRQYVAEEDKELENDNIVFAASVNEQTSHKEAVPPTKTKPVARVPESHNSAWEPRAPSNEVAPSSSAALGSQPAKSSLSLQEILAEAALKRDGASLQNAQRKKQK